MSERVVLITGCSRGIGRATALELAGAGWTVVATLRGPEGRQELEAAGVNVLEADVTRPAEVQAAVDEAARRFGRLDAVVANAGQGLFGCFEELPAERVEALFDLNVQGVLRLARAALPHLRASRGALITVSSIAGRRAAPGSSIYNATKFALEGWAEALYYELEPFGVRVVLIEPGPTESDFARRADPGEARESGPYGAITARLRAFRAEAMGRPEPASTVATAIRRALDMAEPPLRWPTGRGTAAQILAARLLPWGIYRRLVLGKLALPRT